MEILTSSIIGYLIGSIPSAFLVLKYKNGLDIRNEGSGNVGTLNSYEVTNSKMTGIIVLLLDLIKGISSVLIIKFLFGNLFVFSMLALVFSVLGHCYSPWLKFKGGRGLATAAGGILIISPFILLVWLVLWLIIYLIKKEIHLANILATIGVIISVIFSSDFFNSYSFPPAKESFIFGFYVSLMMLIIFSRHLEPIKLYINNYKNKG